VARPARDDGGALMDLLRSAWEWFQPYARPTAIGGMIFIVFNALIIASAILVLAERKIMGFMQQRYGPYLVGPHGAFQPIADILKLLFKEELRPKGADKWLFTLAPVLSVVTAFVAFATVPFGAETTLFGLLDEPIKLGISDVNVGVLVVFAVTSMGVYGIVLAGWSSNSKYSLFGGLRASAQMISYELSYATALAAVILLSGSLSLREVVDSQTGTWLGIFPQWYIFLQPVGFVIYVIAGVAETNRAPFDFPEAEQELVAGYNTEYSSVRFALFPQAEYINMVTMSAVATSLYLGGWHSLLPFYTPLDPLIEQYGLGWLAFLAKVSGFLFVYIWMRWTVPRYRYDQLMKFGWKWLFPASVLNLIVTAALVLYFNA
jgi:NADH-quinone oxidoreductase subunit H